MSDGFIPTESTYADETNAELYSNYPKTNDWKARFRQLERDTGEAIVEATRIGIVRGIEIGRELEQIKQRANGEAKVLG